MLKAGALYFSIVIAFFIAVISASLIMLAAHYRSAYLKEIRYSRLLLNMDSGMEIILSGHPSESKKIIDLYGDSSDSLSIEQKPWGLFDLVILKAFISGDSLKKPFLMGKMDTTDNVVLYLSDEDRPLSVSGDTRITGTALLPKSGIRQSYVDGRAYNGKKMVYGSIKDSKRTLPGLDEDKINKLSGAFNRDLNPLAWLNSGDVNVSFFDTVKEYRLKTGAIITQSLSGNVKLYSDTTVVLSAGAHLDGIQIYAPFIKIEDGFSGNCQLFARDSITIGKKVNFDYPSCVAVIGMKSMSGFPKITCGEALNFNGILFSYEQQRSKQQTLIAVGKNSKVSGEIYTSGVFKMEKGLRINGKVSCTRFLMQNTQTLYENFLIDVQFNRRARSKYYVSSGIFKTGVNQVLKWLD